MTCGVLTLSVQRTRVVYSSHFVCLYVFLGGVGGGGGNFGEGAIFRVETCISTI